MGTSFSCLQKTNQGAAGMMEAAWHWPWGPDSDTCYCMTLGTSFNGLASPPACGFLYGSKQVLSFAA